MLKLNVGVSRKVGLPGYSSAGASCHIEVELPSEVMQDPEKFRAHVEGAYAKANQAVGDELFRLRSRPAPIVCERPPSINGHVHNRTNSSVEDEPDDDRTGDRVPPGTSASARQIRAIETLARRRSTDLEFLLRDDYGVGRPDELSPAEAATLIRRLNAPTADHGVRCRDGAVT